MGLKYEVFMIKGSADNLHSRLLTAFPDRLTDTSDLSRREREWYLHPIKSPNSIEEFKASLDPKDAELEAWMKDGGQTGFHIWWMNHPTRKGFVVGAYTTHWIHDEEFTSAFAGILIKVGIEEFLMVSFHHGSNDGNIYKIHLPDPVGVENYDHEQGEDEKWGKYSKRVNRICGYPVLAWHWYIRNPKIHLVPWEYSVVMREKASEV